MSKLPTIAVASRFALLKIEDDEDNALPTSNNRGGSRKKWPKTKFVPMETQGAKEGMKNKKKSGNKKNKPVKLENDDDKWEDEEDKDVQEAIRLSQMTYDTEETRRRESIEKEDEEDIKLAIGKCAGDQESAGDDQSSAAAGISVSCDDVDAGLGSECVSEIDQFARETTLEAKKIIKGGEDVKGLYNLYKIKYGELVKLAKTMEKELALVKEELFKVKKRNKNYCQILAETETREKAELVHERHKVAIVNEELTQQVSDMHKELEQARSRIHELENEQKKAKTNK